MQTIEIDRLGLTRGCRVLDVGCGNGRHVHATRLLPGIAAVAVDLGAAEVEETACSLRAMDAGDSLTAPAHREAGPWLVARATAYRLPFRDASFDCVIVSEVLEHLHHDDDALREIRRVLKPAGQIALSVPRFGPEALCWALSSRYHEAEGGHVRIYRGTTLRAKLAAHGYAVRAEHFAHALHSPYWWLKCALGVDNTDSRLVRAYHRLLVWDLLRRPRITRLLDRLLNPLIGKSIVLYARESASVGGAPPLHAEGFGWRVAARTVAAARATVLSRRASDPEPAQTDLPEPEGEGG